MKSFTIITTTLVIVSILFGEVWSLTDWKPIEVPWTAVVKIPKIRDYAEAGWQPQDTGVSDKTKDQCPKAGSPLSKVSIAVGEKNGFYYSVDGFTYSPERISVSGIYFNDEHARRGYVNLFLGVPSGISYFDVRPKGNDILVSVDNFNYQRFYFEVHTPYPVTIRNLYIRQYNATAILVDGPSRSALYYKHIPANLD